MLKYKYKHEVNRLFSTAFLYIYDRLEFKMKNMGQGGDVSVSERSCHEA